MAEREKERDQAFTTTITDCRHPVPTITCQSYREERERRRETEILSYNTNNRRTYHKNKKIKKKKAKIVRIG
jgi:hypothetical protein